MVTTVTMDTEDVKKIEQRGMSAASAVAASVKVETSFGVGGRAGGESAESRKEQNAAMEQYKKTRREEKTFVLGGDPPQDVSEETRNGFAEWAKTV